LQFTQRSTNKNNSVACFGPVSGGGFIVIVRHPPSSTSDNVILSGIARLALPMRTIIDLPEQSRQQLDALCRQRGISRAEAIRQALALWLQQQQSDHASVFGLWRDRPEDALALQDALRQEWSQP
jgi:Arc/MetJ-type ribon-helix-helix transcriptional regulator